MRVLITTPCLEETTILFATQKDIFYRPEIAKDFSLLTSAIKKYRPECIVVGANPVTQQNIRLWRKLLPQTCLAIIRRGTGLAAIDREAAKAADIAIYNTPEVNSPYVAEYIYTNLFAKQKEKEHLLLIGSGSIQRIVANKAIDHAEKITIYSPSLAKNKRNQKRWLKENQLVEKNGNIFFTPSLEKALQSGTLISIAIPLTKKGKQPTYHLFNQTHIGLLQKNTKLISICEPDIFSEEALRELYQRRDLQVILDNAPILLSHVKNILEIKSSEQLRKGFLLQSKAISSLECKKDMDEAILLKLGRIYLDTFDPKQVFTQTITTKRISIIGAGISGVMQAIILSLQGYKDITLFDTYSYPLSKKVKDDGITFAGYNCRHVSLTETTPHADRTRKTTLERFPKEGGWQLRKTASLSYTEKQWIAQFTTFTQKPGLHTCANEFVIALNRKGLRLWEELEDKIPELFRDTHKTAFVERLFSSQKALEKALSFQSEINITCKQISKKALLQNHPGLRYAFKEKKLAGGMEIDGFVIQIHTFIENAIIYLQKKGVKLSTETVITKLQTTPKGKTILIDKNGRQWQTDQVIITTGIDAHGLVKKAKALTIIQGVLGCWITIPNPGVQSGLKIHAGDPSGVINSILSPDKKYLHISGGFGYVGNKRLSINSPTVQQLFTKLETEINQIFPNEYTYAKRHKLINRKICIRPMTPDGLPLTESLEKNGKVFFIGGTNSGGTVEAPILGALLAERIKSNSVPTELIFNPLRYSVSPQ